MWCLPCSPASENVGETKCSLDFATRARKVELGAAVKVSHVTVSEWSSGGNCSSPGSTAGRDSPAPGGNSGSPSRQSQVHAGSSSAGGAGSSFGGGSATSSPRGSGRFSAGPSELRQTVTRRAAASSQKEDK